MYNHIKNVKKANLGKLFEDEINKANQIYLDKELAAIYKKPVPIQVVKVEYPDRSMAKITEAFYRIPSTTDYNGIYRGKYIDFEAKSCNSDYFPFSRIYEHQINHLEFTYKLGGISFLIIKFELRDETFIIPTNILSVFYNNAKKDGKKGLKYEDVKEFGLKVENQLFLDYLKTIDQIIDN